MEERYGERLEKQNLIMLKTRFTLQGRGAKHLFILEVVIIMLTSCFNLNYVTERHEHYTASGRVEDIDVSVASWLLSDIDFTGHSNLVLRHRASRSL